MTSTPAQLTQTHRAQQLLVRRATVSAMAKLWPTLDWASLDASYPTFAVQVGKLVQANRQTSSGLAARYLQAFRKASGVAGQLRLVLADPLPADQFATSLRVTSVVALKNAAQAGTDPAIALSNALSLSQGAMARLALDAGRETVLASVKADRRAWGVQRVLGGAGCPFCVMLADRGAVYKDDSGDFQAHDHCGCTTEPVYDN